MDEPHTLNVKIVIQYSVEVTYSPAGSGTCLIEQSPTIPNDTGWYDSGTPLSIRAVPEQGFKLTGWSGNVIPGSAASILNITIAQPVDANALFSGTTTEVSTTSNAQGQSSMMDDSFFLVAGAILVVTSVYIVYFFAFKERNAGKVRPPRFIPSAAGPIVK
jgi:hypothetical protein